MIKIVANVSKKVPIPGQDYSSQCYTAGMEVEVADGTTTEAVQERLRQVYALLEASIDQKIAAHGSDVRQVGSATIQAQRQPVNRLPQPEGAYGGNGNGRRRPATRAQVKAIHAIASAADVPWQELDACIQATYAVTKLEELTVAQASEVIEALKSRQPA